jgi:hypothetical protein
MPWQIVSYFPPSLPFFPKDNRLYHLQVKVHAAMRQALIAVAG